MEERYRVSTPENISFSFVVAGIGSRFLAALIDLVIYLVVSLALSIAYSQGQRFVVSEHTWSIVTALYIGFTFLLYWVYYILFEIIWAGQTPGKRLGHIRVVRLDGTPASPAQIVIRNIARLVDLFPGFYAVGLVSMFISSQSRRLGDFAAGTLVVREARSALSLSELSQVHAPVDVSQETVGAGTLPTHLLNKSQRQLIRDFLQRRARIGEPQRSTYAVRIAADIAVRMGITVPINTAQAEQLLEQTAAVMDK